MNSKYNYEIGAVYGLKRLISLVKENGYTMAEVECVKCGRKSKVRPNSLYKEKTTSCICQAKTISGKYAKKLSGVYHNIKYRCYTPTAKAYKNYGEWTFGFVCDLSLEKPQSTIENHNMSE